MFSGVLAVNNEGKDEKDATPPVSNSIFFCMFFPYVDHIIIKPITK
jgi:hypothetical protein